MSKFREKAQVLTKQTIGQMIGDDALVQQGREQQRRVVQPTKPDDPNDEGSDRSLEGSDRSLERNRRSD